MGCERDEVKTTGRGRGRPPELTVEARREAILDAAQTLMVEKGLHAASMTAIAAAAGMSKRTLYKVFDSRGALFAAWVDRARTSFVRPLDVNEYALPLAERLARMLIPDMDAGERGAALAVLRAAIVEAVRHPELGRTFLDEGPRKARALVRDELARAVDRGEIALDDIDLAARILGDMVYESPVDRLLDPSLPPPDAAADRRRLEMAIALFLNGVSTK